jgi:serine/threonine protein kinase
VDYVAPELLRQRPYDGRADVWSAGVVVYILLVGYAPFFGDDDDAIMRHIETGSFAFNSPNW